jgi:hypothetical protein
VSFRGAERSTSSTLVRGEEGRDLTDRRDGADARQVPRHREAARGLANNDGLEVARERVPVVDHGRFVANEAEVFDREVGVPDNSDAGLLFTEARERW